MVINVCTVVLEALIKNYAIRGIDISFSLNQDNYASAKWREEYTSNLNELLCGNQEVVVNVLRKLFANGSTKDLISPSDWEELKRNNQEGKDYCIRVLHEDETICILAKREIK